MLSTKALQVGYSVEFHRLSTLGPTHCTTPIPRRYGILMHPDASWISWLITAASIASIASIVARCQNLAMSSHQPCRPVVLSSCPGGQTSPHLERHRGRHRGRSSICSGRPRHHCVTPCHAMCAVHRSCLYRPLPL